MSEPTITKQENELLQHVTFGIGEEVFVIDNPSKVHTDL